MPQQSLVQRDGESMEEYSRRLQQLVEENRRTASLEEDDPESAGTRTREVTSEAGGAATILPRVPPGAFKAADVDPTKPFNIIVTNEDGDRLANGIHDPALHGEPLDPKKPITFVSDPPKLRKEEAVVSDIKQASDKTRMSYDKSQSDAKRESADAPAPKKRRRRTASKTAQLPVRTDARPVTITFYIGDMEFDVAYLDSLVVKNLMVFVSNAEEKSGFQPKPTEHAMKLSIGDSAFKAYFMGAYEYGSLRFTQFLYAGDVDEQHQ